METKQVAMNIGLHRKIKQIALIKGMKIQAIVEQAVTKWINEQDQERGQAA